MNKCSSQPSQQRSKQAACFSIVASALSEILGATSLNHYCRLQQANFFPELNRFRRLHSKQATCFSLLQKRATSAMVSSVGVEVIGSVWLGKVRWNGPSLISGTEWLYFLFG
jgi:hypothetical protein